MTDEQQSLSISFKLISAILALIVVGLLAYIGFSQPWDSNSSKNSDSATITATGEATVSAQPDEFVFYPYFEVDADTQEELAVVTRDLNNRVIAEIKALGIADKDISNDASAWEAWYYPDDQPERLRANVQINFKTNDRDIAQKAADYLIDNAAKGQLTPQTQFSETLRKSLESDARQQAINDAKSKADQLADGFDAKLGDLKSVQTSEDGFGYPYPIALEGREDSAISSDQSITIQPGENELRYTVTAEFYLD